MLTSGLPTHPIPFGVTQFLNKSPDLPIEGHIHPISIDFTPQTSSNNPQINRETSSEAGLGLQYKNRESQEYPDTQESAVEVGYQLSIIQIVL